VATMILTSGLDSVRHVRSRQLAVAQDVELPHAAALIRCRRELEIREMAGVHGPLPRREIIVSHDGAENSLWSWSTPAAHPRGNRLRHYPHHGRARSAALAKSLNLSREITYGT